MRLGLAVLAVALSACVVAVQAPPPGVIPAPQAVALATHFARSRGIIVDYTRSARLDPYARWHVDLGGAGGRDRALVTLDGYSGRVLTARLWGPQGEFAPGFAPPPPSSTPGPPAAAEPEPAEPPTPPPSAPPPPPPPAN